MRHEAVFTVALGLLGCLSLNGQIGSYQIGRMWRDTPDTIVMTVSVAVADLTPRRLVSLLAGIRERYSDRQAVSVTVFSSRRAAERYSLASEIGDYGHPVDDWSSEARAVYSFSAKAKEEYVLITPSGLHGPFEMRIDLPVTKAPQCALSLSGRCLLILEPPTYPLAAREAKVAGDVVLRGMMTTDGWIEQVQLLSRPPRNGLESLLVEEAIRNLKGWRMETSDKEKMIEVVFHYVIDFSVTDTSAPSIQFSPPGHIQIRAHPIR